MFINKGSFHWYIQRFSAILLFFFFIALFLFDVFNIVIGLFILILLTFHIEAGLETFIIDYMHTPFSLFISELLVDLFVVFFIKSFFLTIFYF
uniref:Succinate:cytochrome c oxidoreductase subunit 4 n=1 Tax=Storeatula sp. CCMP1868 TaxID=195070 RepID=A0A2P1G863_9CRYP|nr:succinate:cytochrome c oxidoreductase subunit 4 [Storeatula sp. CCMP1868]AVM81140.1 succinate:cytochrome c oxidoreductase subunit 4 [Storeatula sp. CCMP1868]